MGNAGEEVATFYIEKSFEFVKFLARWAPRTAKFGVRVLGKGAKGLGALGVAGFHYANGKIEAHREAKASDLYQAYKRGERIYDFTTDRAVVESRFSDVLSQDDAVRLKQENDIFEIFSKVMSKKGYETRVNSCMNGEDGYTVCASTKFPIIEANTQDIVNSSLKNKHTRSDAIAHLDQAQTRFEAVATEALQEVQNYLDGKTKTFIVQDAVAQHLMGAAHEYGVTLNPAIDEFGQTTEQSITCNVLESYDLENIFEKSAVRTLNHGEVGVDCCKVELTLDEYQKLRCEGGARVPAPATEHLSADKNIEGQALSTTKTDDDTGYVCVAYCDMANPSEMNKKYRDATGVVDASKLSETQGKVVMYVRAHDQKKLQLDLEKLGLNSYKQKGMQLVDKKRAQITFNPDTFIEQAHYIAKSINEKGVFAPTKQR